MKSDESSLYNVFSKLEGIRWSLFDLANWKNGLAFKKNDFADDGLPIIKIAELNNGISASTSYAKGLYNEDVFIHKGDLLFSWSGNPETSIDIYRYNLQDGWLNQHIFKVTVNESIVIKDYFYYVMKSLKPFFTKIATNKQTTGLGHITISDLKRLSLIVPQKSIQDIVVEILKPLDDKIALNTAINENLHWQAA